MSASYRGEESIRYILADEIVELDEEISRKRNANNIDDLKPRISKCETHTFWTQEILSLKYNCGNTDGS